MRLVAIALAFSLAGCCGGENDHPPAGTGGSLALAPSAPPEPAAPPCVAAGALALPRYGHSVTVLADGRALVAGGKLRNGAQFVADVDVWDPATRVFSPGPKLARPRADHVAVRAKDGAVVIFGGETEVRGGVDPEIVDAKAEHVKPGPKIGEEPALFSPFLVALDDGRVFLGGGELPQAGAASAQAAYLDPKTNALERLPNLPHSGGGEARLRRDGKILLLFADPTADHDEAWMFDPAARTYAKARSTEVPSIPARGDSFLDAEVLEEPGEPTLARSETALHRWDAPTQTWVKTAQLLEPREAATSVRLSKHELFVVGGVSTREPGTKLGSAEICAF